MPTLLNVRDLHVHYSGPHGSVVQALNGASLRIREGEVLGILGESGSGKSTIARTLLRLLPKNANVAGGAVEFEGRNLLRLAEAEMNEIRGARLAMISQEPSQALNPVLKVGDQIAEVIRAHRDWSAKRCRLEAESMLDRVNLRSIGKRKYDAYPHQLSGGQQQRVVIAQALACNPALIVADEPTASLDSTTEIEILDLFRDLKVERKTSLLLITHDPTILPGLADRVAVLYAGRIVEDAATDSVFESARHPYVRALLDCLPPSVTERRREYRFKTIEGIPPDPGRLVDGCSFSPRCPERMEKCLAGRPSAQDIEEERRVECFLYDR